jgi:predicted RNase H-like HicB family nuclease
VRAASGVILQKTTQLEKAHSPHREPFARAVLVGVTWQGKRRTDMHTFTAVIERCPDTGLFVGYVPGFPGAHSQGETLDELNRNLTEVIEMLLEDGEPQLEAEFIGIQAVRVP